MKKFNISKQEEKQLINEIQLFFKNERGEDIGELFASIVLDFIIEKIGPSLYNQGVYDAHKFLNDSLDDLLSITK
ncbi:MAG: DUF2164 domain-containing protein [Sarcina sp.]